MTAWLSAHGRTVAAIELAVLAIAGMLHTAFAIPGLEYPGATDFGKYYASARFVWEGKSIYTPLPMDALGPLPEGVDSDRSTLHPNLSPPPLTLYLAPLGLLPYRAAFLTWTALSFAFGVAAVALLGAATAAPGRRLARFVALLALAMAYFPTLANTRLGQVSLLLLLLFTVVWWAARSGRDALAGIALGLALTVKPFAGVVVLFFLVRRRWRLVAWCAGACAAALLAGLALLGPGTYRDYLDALGGVTWYATNWNASFLGFFSRIFGGSENVPLVDWPWLARALAYVLSAAGTAGLAWNAWPRRERAGRDLFDVGFGLSLVLMLLVSPLGWMYYLPVLLVPAVCTWDLAPRWKATRGRWVLAGAWVLSTLPLPLVPARQVNQPLGWLTWDAVYFYALLLLAALLSAMLGRMKQGPTGGLGERAGGVGDGR